MKQNTAALPISTSPAPAEPSFDFAGVPAGARPSVARATAAARLAGGPARSATANAAIAAVLLPHESVPGREETPREHRHLHVVEAPALTPAQRRRRARAVLIISATLATLVALGLVYMHVVLAQRQFRLDQLNAEVQKDQATYENLRLQVAELASPQHIISTAEGKLGMIQPAQVTYLSPITTVAGSASQVVPTAAARAAAKASSAPAALGNAGWPLVKAQLAGSS
jgi:cell division protein FtsL